MGAPQQYPAYSIRWTLESFGPDSELQRASLDVKLGLESIYQDLISGERR